MWTNLNNLWKNIFTFYSEFDFSEDPSGDYLSEFSRIIIQNDKWFHSQKLTKAEINKILSLKNLDLSGLNISDLKPIAKFKKLNVLNLKNNNIKTIASLTGCNKLQILDISDNKIKTIKPIASHSNLKKLKLDSKLNYEDLKNNNPNCVISLNFKKPNNEVIHNLSSEEMLQLIADAQNEFEYSTSNQELFRDANC